MHAAITETRSSTESILDYSTLKQLSDGPNWNALPRLSRDGTSTIKVHDGTLPEENLRYRILIFHTVLSGTRTFQVRFGKMCWIVVPLFFFMVTGSRVCWDLGGSSREFV